MATKPEVSMSYPLSGGRRLRMYRWLSPFVLDWTWGIQIDDGPIEWYDDHYMASVRFDVILELNQKENP